MLLIYSSVALDQRGLLPDTWASLNWSSLGVWLSLDADKWQHCGSGVWAGLGLAEKASWAAGVKVQTM